MLHVERKYPKRWKHPRKPIGFHAKFIKESQSSWNKQTFKHLWLKFMIWNRNALREEGGVSTNTSQIAYSKRFAGKTHRTFSFQFIHNI